MLDLCEPTTQHKVTDDYKGFKGIFNVFFNVFMDIQRKSMFNVYNNIFMIKYII